MSETEKLLLDVKEVLENKDEEIENLKKKIHQYKVNTSSLQEIIASQKNDISRLRDYVIKLETEKNKLSKELKNIDSYKNRVEYLEKVLVNKNLEICTLSDHMIHEQEAISSNTASVLETRINKLEVMMYNSSR